MIKKLVVCVLTYNRSEAIKVFIDKEIEILNRNQVDLIVYDSSEDEETEEIVHSFINRGYSNLLYKRVDSIMKSNEKFYYVAANIDKKYEYVWITHDHTIFNKESLEFIIKNLSAKPDFIYLKTQSDDFNIIQESDLNSFFVKSVWQLGRFGAAILRQDSFLKQAKWDSLVGKYLTESKMNFSHIGLYFQVLSEMDNPKIITLEFPREFFYDTFRFNKLSWESESIRICLGCWGEVISALPKIYTDKKEALESIDKYFISKYNLINLKKNKKYNIVLFLKYYKWIKVIVPEMRTCCFVIALIPSFFSNYIYYGRVFKAIRKAQKMRYKVCIYGAGRHGVEILSYIQNNGINVDAVLVTDKKGNPEAINDIPIYQSEDYLKKNRTFIVIAVSKNLQPGIIEYISQFNWIKYLCF